MDEQPDRANEIAQGFGEREGLANQTGTAGRQGGVEAFQMIGLAAALLARAMAFGGQDNAVGGQRIRVQDSPLPVGRWQVVPQVISVQVVAFANDTADNQPRVSVLSQKDPGVIALAAHIRPHFIAFHH